MSLLVHQYEISTAFPEHPIVVENLEDGRSENLRALDALRTKSENSQQSTNKLEETP